jgi:phosphoglycolate phosphatase
MISWAAMDAIFFDLDGTLTDPLDGIANSIAFAFEGLGLPVPGRDEMRTFVGPPIQDSMRARFGDEALVAGELAGADHVFHALHEVASLIAR